MKKLVLLFTVLLGLLSCRESGPETLDVKISVSEIIFGGSPSHSFTFSIGQGPAWKIDASALPWAVVSPSEGSGSREVKVYVAADDNTTEDCRSGSFKITSGNQSKELTVFQRPSFANEAIGVAGPTLSFPAVAKEPITLKVYSDNEWHLVTRPNEWSVISPSSGYGHKVTQLSLKPSTNTGDARAISFSIVSSKSEEYTLSATQSAAIKGPVLIAWWSLGDDEFLHEWNDSHNDCWFTSKYVPADIPAGTLAKMLWNAGEGNKHTMIISSDQNGHWAVKPVWYGDNLEFDIPLAGIDEAYLTDGVLKAGSVVNMKIATSGVASMAKYWAAEYYDNGEWKMINPSTFTAVDQNTVTATFAHTGASEPYDLDVSVTYSVDIKDSVRMRLRPIENKYSIDGKVISSVTAGTALRVRPGTGFGEANDAVSFYIIK